MESGVGDRSGSAALARRCGTMGPGRAKERGILGWRRGEPTPVAVKPAGHAACIKRNGCMVLAGGAGNQSSTTGLRKVRAATRAMRVDGSLRARSGTRSGSDGSGDDAVGDGRAGYARAGYGRAGGDRVFLAGAAARAAEFLASADARASYRASIRPRVDGDVMGSGAPGDLPADRQRNIWPRSLPREMRTDLSENGIESVGLTMVYPWLPKPERHIPEPAHALLPARASAHSLSDRGIHHD